jgi:hypothetical protein
MSVAAGCHSPEDPWCGDRPAQFCEQERLNAFTGDPPPGYWNSLTDIHTRYSEACPDAQAISDLVSLGPIAELGAGNGYWARLLRDACGDVVAFDRRLRAQNWSEVLAADESALEAQRGSHPSVRHASPPE